MSCEQCNSPSMRQLRTECQNAKDDLIEIEDQNEQLRKAMSRYEKSEKKWLVKLSLEDISVIQNALEDKLKEISKDAEDYLNPDSILKDTTRQKKAFHLSNHINELFRVLE